MKLLADTCVSRAAVIEWGLAGHDVLYAGELDRDPGDAELLRRARDEVASCSHSIRISAPWPFSKQPHCGIIRLVGFRAGEQGSAGLEALATHAGELASGALVTVEPSRTRVRGRDE